MIAEMRRGSIFRARPETHRIRTILGASCKTFMTPASTQISLSCTNITTSSGITLSRRFSRKGCRSGSLRMNDWLKEWTHAEVDAGSDIASTQPAED